MSFFDTLMSDTVGVVYRATTGKNDPWTLNEINSNGAQDRLNAWRGPGNAGNTTPPQNAEEQAIYDGYLADNVATTDQIQEMQPKNVCGLTSADFNLWECVTQKSPWLLWVGGGLVVVLALYLIRPYVELAKER